MNTYFVTAHVPVFNWCLVKESLSYNTDLTEGEPISDIALSNLTNKLQTLTTSFECTLNWKLKSYLFGLWDLGGEHISKS